MLKHHIGTVLKTSQPNQFLDEIIRIKSKLGIVHLKLVSLDSSSKAEHHYKLAFKYQREANNIENVIEICTYIIERRGLINSR